MTFTPKFVDLVRNIAIVQGTGPVALGGPVNGYTSLADAAGVGEQFYYCIQGVDRPEEREVGHGTMLADGRVGRDPVGGILTEFSNGLKTIALVAPAEWYAKLERVSGELDAALPGALKARSAFAVEENLAVGVDASVSGNLSVDGTVFANGNLTVGGALNVTSPNTAFGPILGEPSDSNFYIDNTNYNGFLNFRSWSSGIPQVDGWVRGRRGSGLEINGSVGVIFLLNGMTVANVLSSGIDLAPGMVVKVSGLQVVGSQQEAIADDASGAANQSTINAILAALRNHGLIST